MRSGRNATGAWALTLAADFLTKVFLSHLRNRLALFVLVLCTLTRSAAAQEDEPVEGASEEEQVLDPAAQESAAEVDVVNKANNPLADLVAVQLHNYYTPKLYGVPDESANTFWLRILAPYKRLIPRLSLPVKTSPTVTPDSKTGLGDLDVFVSILATKPEKPLQFGIGPLYVAPTATDAALGSGKHQLGLASVLVYPTGPLLFAAIVTWQISVAGDSARAKTNSIIFQPFMTIQLGKGYYLRSSPAWFFDIETGDYNIPFGLGAGKVLRHGKAVFNLFLEPQFTLAHKGIGQPAIQIFAAINIQFITGKR